MSLEKEKRARQQIDAELKQQLQTLLPIVLAKTGFESIHSLNAKIGGHFLTYIDIRNAVFYSHEQFIGDWLTGLQSVVEKHRIPGKPESGEERTYELLREHKEFQQYVYLFLKRNYIKNIDSLTKKKPTVEESEVWIGQNNASYGLLITPRFKNGKWENDKSEIRHFKPKYWTIGHVLKTGLCVPGQDSKVEFTSIDQYLAFFKDVVVAASGSKYEYAIAEKYCDFVSHSSNALDIPLLIPEFRYDGIEVKHVYRLDFTIIDPTALNKVGFELSPWSTHGYLSQTKQMSQAQINEIAKDNFAIEMKKHKDFFIKHGIATLIYTDKELADLDAVFRVMRNYLESKSKAIQINYHIFNEFFNNPLNLF